MAFDKGKYDAAYIANAYYPRITLGFKKAEPNIYAALQYAAKHKGISVTNYCRQATISQLQRDNYLICKDGNYYQIIRDENGKQIIIEI